LPRLLLKLFFEPVSGGNFGDFRNDDMPALIGREPTASIGASRN
jgi:hypothetical protein